MKLKMITAGYYVSHAIAVTPEATMKLVCMRTNSGAFAYDHDFGRNKWALAAQVTQLGDIITAEYICYMADTLADCRRYAEKADYMLDDIIAHLAGDVTDEEDTTIEEDTTMTRFERFFADVQDIDCGLTMDDITELAHWTLSDGSVIAAHPLGRDYGVEVVGYTSDGEVVSYICMDNGCDNAADLDAIDRAVSAGETLATIFKGWDNGLGGNPFDLSYLPDEYKIYDSEIDDYDTVAARHTYTELPRVIDQARQTATQIMQDAASDTDTNAELDKLADILEDNQRQYDASQPAKCRCIIGIEVDGIRVAEFEHDLADVYDVNDIVDVMILLGVPARSDDEIIHPSKYTLYEVSVYSETGDLWSHHCYWMTTMYEIEANDREDSYIPKLTEARRRMQSRHEGGDVL